MTEYRPIVGWEGRYEMSQDGEVRSCSRIVPAKGRQTTYATKPRVIRYRDKLGRVVLLNGKHQKRAYPDKLLAEAWADPGRVMTWAELCEERRLEREKGVE